MHPGATLPSVRARLSPAVDRVLRLLSIIRLKPFDTSTPAGRANERVRRAFWSASTASVAKGVNTLTMLVVVRITLGYLSAERYGLWMTITSVVAFLAISDLGIGNSVLNLVSQAHGKNDSEAARRCVTSAFALLCCVAGILGIAFALVYPHVPWPRFFNVFSPLAQQEAGPAMAALVACVLVNLPLSIVPRIQMGYQEGYLNSPWQTISNLVGLVVLITLVRIKVGLPYLVIGVAAGPILENALNAAYLFGFRRRWLMPNRQSVSRAYVNLIVRTGFLFLLLQLSQVAIIYADNLIIAHVLGPEAVTAYAVPARLFSILTAVVYIFLNPLWPAYAEATARGDNAWAKAVVARTALSTLAVCFAVTLALLVFGDRIFQVWTNSKVPFSLPLMAALGAWTTVSLLVSGICLYLNAIDKIRFQVVFSILTAGLSILAKVLLATRVGLPGVVWGNIITSALFMLLPYTLYVSRRFAGQAEPQMA